MPELQEGDCLPIRRPDWEIAAAQQVLPRTVRVRDVDSACSISTLPVERDAGSVGGPGRECRQARTVRKTPEVTAATVHRVDVGSPAVPEQREGDPLWMGALRRRRGWPEDRCQG